MGKDPTDRELLWRQYNLHIDLYKYYFDLIIKTNTFFYAITGSILTFYFANLSNEFMKYSLLLPIIMSIGLAGAFIYGARLMVVVREDVFDLRDKLGLETAPDVQVLIT